MPLLQLPLHDNVCLECKFCCLFWFILVHAVLYWRASMLHVEVVTVSLQQTDYPLCVHAAAEVM